MRLKVLSAEDCEQVRLWRNLQLESLRTPFPLAKEQQREFYETVICNRQSAARFWGIWHDCGDLQPEKECLHLNYLLFRGMCGLENISHENRSAEISLLLNPDHRDKLYEALRLLLREGFLNLNLRNIYTEVYGCNPDIDNWLCAYMQFKRYAHEIPVLPNRKYWNGQYYDSLYLNITKEDFFEHENLILESTQALN